MTERERTEIEEELDDFDEESTEADTEPQVVLGVMGQEQDVTR